MLQVIIKKLPHQMTRCHSYCHLRYASRIPGNTAVVQPDNATNVADTTPSSINLVEAVAIPVENAPTIDVSRRGSTGIVQINTNLKGKEPEILWTVTPDLEPSRLLSHYKKLSKFRLTSLVVITSMGGYVMAPALFDLTTFAFCAIGTGLVSAAANSINQYHEVPFDSQMSRTKNRVLVTGLLTPAHAVAFAFVTASVGLSMLYFGVNGLTAALGAGNLFLYTMIYTPMKRISIMNTWVGSVVGAIPPLMGWAGCSGTLDVGACILAGLLYAWQFPHFNALSWNLRPDYSRAGYRMMAVTNPGLCRRTALRYTAAIGVLSIAAPFLDVTNIWFALETLPLNAYFCYLAWKFYQKSDSGTSRKLFRFSLLHLPAIMLLFLFNKKRWYFAEATVKSDQTILEASSVNTIDVAENSGLKSLHQTTSTSLIDVFPVAVAAASEIPAYSKTVFPVATADKKNP